VTDYSIHFGEGASSPDNPGRVWDDALKYRFICGGWTPQANREFRKMTRGDRVWVRWERRGKPNGYIARGIVIRDPAPVARAIIVDPETGQDVRFIDVMTGMEGRYATSREEMDVVEPSRREVRAEGSDDRIAEWVAAVRWEHVRPVSERILHAQVPSPSVTTGALTRPADLALLLELMPVMLDEGDEVEWNSGDVIVRKGTRKSIPRGGDNSESEQAAVAAVTAWYEARGAKVMPLANDDRLGYDLDVVHHGKHLLVEVKGRADGVAAPELENSQWTHVESLNPSWRLAVVTYSTSNPVVQVWTAEQVAVFTTEVTRRRVWCIE
jgi:hypothetical protein